MKDVVGIRAGETTCSGCAYKALLVLRMPACTFKELKSSSKSANRLFELALSSTHFT